MVQILANTLPASWSTLKILLQLKAGRCNPSRAILHSRCSSADGLKSIISIDCCTTGQEVWDPPNYPQIVHICIPKWCWRQFSKYRKPFPYKNNLSFFFQEHDTKLYFLMCCIFFSSDTVILISTRDSEKNRLRSATSSKTSRMHSTKLVLCNEIPT